MLKARVSSTARPFAEVSKGYTQFQDGDVIFAKITPCMENGKIAIARSLKNGVACGSTEFHVVRPSGRISPDYIWRFLRQNSFREDAEASMTGAVGQRRVPASFLKQSRLPVPPLPEQRRIVAKIDSLTAKSARARNHLDHIPRLVEKYKQAILTAAFRSDASSHWHHCQLEDVLAEAVIGLVRSKAEQHSMEGVSYVRMNHFDLNGQWNSGVLTKVSITPAELQKYRLEIGDVLFNTRNSYELVGKVAVWPGADQDHVYNNNLLRLRFTPPVFPKFAALQMMTAPFRLYLEGTKSATTSVCAIYQRSVMVAPFRYPSLDEQGKIIHRIETAFAWIDRLAKEASSARKLVDHLDQAVLAKAFRGELVPQDPNDEPASALLDRIKAERAKAAPQPVCRPRNPNPPNPNPDAPCPIADYP